MGIRYTGILSKKFPHIYALVLAEGATNYLRTFYIYTTCIKFGVGSIRTYGDDIRYP